jgi:hypothetical protein
MASSLIPALAVTTPSADVPPMPVTDGEHGGLLRALTEIPDLYADTDRVGRR